MPPVSGLPRVLVYAADLCRDQDGPIGVALRDWVLINAIGLGHADEARARLQRTPRRTDSASLMVFLRPAGNDRDRFYLTV